MYPIQRGNAPDRRFVCTPVLLHSVRCTGYRWIRFLELEESNSKTPGGTARLIPKSSLPVPHGQAQRQESGVNPTSRFRVRRWSCMPRHRRRHGAHVTGRTVISQTPARPFTTLSCTELHPTHTHTQRKSHFRCFNFAHLLKYLFLWYIPLLHLHNGLFPGPCPAHCFST